MLADFLSSIIPALRPIFDSLAESGNGLDQCRNFPGFQNCENQ